LNTAIAQRPTHVRYYVLAALLVITIVNYLQRNSIGPLESTVRNALETDKTMMGAAGAAFFWIYALMQIPAGRLAQRWGPRLTLALYCVGWSIAAAAMALSVSVYDLIAYRGIMGAFQAGIFPCATLIMVAWLSASRRGFASALLNSFMLIGGILASHLTGILLAPLGWHWVMIAYAAPGIVLGTWFYLWFRNRPNEHRGVNAGELAIIRGPDVAGTTETTTAERTASAIPWRAILLSVPLWLICAQQFCRAGSNRFLDVWLATYLQEVPLRSMEGEDARKEYASHMTALPSYGAILGGPFGGLISDGLLRRIKRRRIARNGVAAVALALAVCCYLPVFLVKSAELQVFFFSLGYFMATLAAPCAYALSMDVGGKNLPIVFGAMNMFGNFGAAAMSQAVPLVNDYLGGWNSAIMLFIAMHAVAAVIWFFLNPNRTIGESASKESSSCVA
jgi:MFS transporter, ACS family, D-galactonate transporter